MSRDTFDRSRGDTVAAIAIFAGGAIIGLIITGVAASLGASSEVVVVTAAGSILNAALAVDDHWERMP